MLLFVYALRMCAGELQPEAQGWLLSFVWMIIIICRLRGAGSIEQHGSMWIVFIFRWWLACRGAPTGSARRIVVIWRLWASSIIGQPESSPSSFNVWCAGELLPGVRGWFFGGWGQAELRWGFFSRTEGSSLLFLFFFCCYCYHHHRHCCFVVVVVASERLLTDNNDHVLHLKCVYKPSLL